MRGRVKASTRPEWRVWLKRLRWEKGIQQGDMPRLILEKTGVKLSLQTYKNWEVGRTTPNQESWELISRTLDISMFDISQRELIRSLAMEEAERDSPKKRKRQREGVFFES